MLTMPNNQVPSDEAVENAAVEVVREHGGPLELEPIASRVRRRLDVNEDRLSNLRVWSALVEATQRGQIDEVRNVAWEPRPQRP